MTRDEWLRRLAERLGIEPPTPEEVKGLLEVAATAAHTSERTAAPISCWLAGRSDLALEDVRAAADAIAEEEGAADG